MRHPAFISVLVLAAGANAQIIGGSNLIDNSDVNTLAGWLGQGNLTLNNIFDHTAGDGKDSYQFHAAADYQGATFVIIRDENGNIFGGYNPQSWESIGDYHYSNSPDPRDAFLFNLTQNMKIDQKQDGDGGQGQYQTYNAGNYGPTFGGGHDLWVPQDLTNSAYTNGYSYGNILDGQPFGYTQLSPLTDLEVFTIAVPAPGAGALLGIGGLVAARRRRS